MMKKEEKSDDRRCTQVQCGFYTQGGCKSCDDCKSEPYIIGTTCRRCIACEGVPNCLRWGEKKFSEEEQKQINRILEAMVAVANSQQPEPEQPKKKEEPMVM
jgi:hypothetical protein